MTTLQNTEKNQHQLGTGDNDGLLVAVQYVRDVRHHAVLVLLDHGVAEGRVLRQVQALVAVGQSDAALEYHDAPAVEHLRPGFLVLLEEVRQVGVVVAAGAPAEDPGEVVARAERQHAHLALLLRGRERQGGHIFRGVLVNLRSGL